MTIILYRGDIISVSYNALEPGLERRHALNKKFYNKHDEARHSANLKFKLASIHERIHTGIFIRTHAHAHVRDAQTLTSNFVDKYARCLKIKGIGHKSNPRGGRSNRVCKVVQERQERGEKVKVKLRMIIKFRFNVEVCRQSS